jgi:hypothetical protein
VEKWILKQLVKLGSLIGNDITKVYGYLGSRLGGIENTISQLAGQVNNLVAEGGSDVVNTVENVGNTVNNWAALLDPYIADALSQFAKDVITPLRNDVKSLDPGLYNSVSSEWDHFKKYDLPGLKKDIADAKADAHKAVSFIDHSALDAIHLIDECWDWLEHLARHPVKEIEAIPAGLKAALPSAWTETAAEPATSEIDKVIDWLTKELPSV